MMKIVKRCNKVNCRNFTGNSYESYCEEHKGVANKEYNEFRNTYDKEYVSFYKSRAWQKKRLVALKRDHWVCKDCETEGLITIAQEVHHIVETKNDWSKRLELDNLISLCRTHHDKRHNR